MQGTRWRRWVGRLGTWVGQDFKRRLEKSEDTIRAWLDGVRGSDHGGAALEKPAFQEIIYTERAASYVLIEALSAGAYPNLHSLYAGCIMQGGEVWAAFVHGAPCAGTLREVRVSDPRIWPSQAELCSILPHLELTIEH